MADVVNALPIVVYALPAVSDDGFRSSATCCALGGTCSRLTVSGTTCRLNVTWRAPDAICWLPVTVLPNYDNVVRPAFSSLPAAQPRA